MLPSGPAAMSSGWLSGDASGNSVTAPAGVIRANLFALFSVNQRLPSGPVAMPAGRDGADAVPVEGAARHGDLEQPPRRRHPADAARAVTVLGEPEVSVRAGRDEERIRILVRQRKLGERAARRDPAELVAEQL